MLPSVTSAYDASLGKKARLEYDWDALLAKTKSENRATLTIRRVLVKAARSIAEAFNPQETIKFVSVFTDFIIIARPDTIETEFQVKCALTLVKHPRHLGMVMDFYRNLHATITRPFAIEALCVLLQDTATSTLLFARKAEQVAWQYGSKAIVSVFDQLRNKMVQDIYATEVAVAEVLLDGEEEDPEPAPRVPSVMPPKPVAKPSAATSKSVAMSKPAAASKPASDDSELRPALSPDSDQPEQLDEFKTKKKHTKRRERYTARHYGKLTTFGMLDLKDKRIVHNATLEPITSMSERTFGKPAANLDSAQTAQAAAYKKRQDKIAKQKQKIRKSLYGDIKMVELTLEEQEILAERMKAWTAANPE